MSNVYGEVSETLLYDPKITEKIPLIIENSYPKDLISIPIKPKKKVFKSYRKTILPQSKTGDSPKPKNDEEFELENVVIGEENIVTGEKNVVIGEENIVTGEKNIVTDEEKEETDEETEETEETEENKNKLLKYLNESLLSIIWKSNYYHFTAVAERHSLKSYHIITLIFLIIFHIGYIIITFIQLFIFGFSIKIIYGIILAILAFGEFLWMYQKIFMEEKSPINDIFKWIIIIGSQAMYYFFIFLAFSQLHVTSFFIVHITTIISSYWFFYPVIIKHAKFNDVRAISPLLDGTAHIISILFFVLAYGPLSGYPGSMIWPFVLYWLCSNFQYINEVIEMFEGITGVYDKLEIATILFALNRLVYFQMFTMISILLVLRTYGLAFILPKPYGNYYLVINIPNSWFDFL